MRDFSVREVLELEKKKLLVEERKGEGEKREKNRVR